jgi:periplasmic glucans biosynthesis protein
MSFAAGLLGIPRSALAAADLKLGPAQPFSFDELTHEAETRAARAYEKGKPLPEQVLNRLDYEAVGKIKFNPDYALFRDGPGAYPVTFFHLGRFFQSPVHMFVLASAANPTQAREILYSTQYFTMPADSPAHQLPADAGFAGFRFQESRLEDQHKLDWRSNDWVAFLGASYFRSIGELYQYGLSSHAFTLNRRLRMRTRSSSTRCSRDRASSVHIALPCNVTRPC